MFNSRLEDKDGVEDNENHQILEQVKAFFELYEHNWFCNLDEFKDQRIASMAGRKTVYKDAVTFFRFTIGVSKRNMQKFQTKICDQLDDRKKIFAGRSQ